jgi:hypothetical protein
MTFIVNECALDRFRSLLQSDLHSWMWNFETVKLHGTAATVLGSPEDRGPGGHRFKAARRGRMRDMQISRSIEVVYRDERRRLPAPAWLDTRTQAAGAAAERA